MGEGLHQLHHDDEGRRQLIAKLLSEEQQFTGLFLPLLNVSLLASLRPHSNCGRKKRKFYENVGVRNLPGSVDLGSSAF